MGMRRFIGAHDVGVQQLYIIAWLSGVFSVLWSLLAGAGILLFASELFTSDSWKPLLGLINGYKPMVGWIILTGGLLGVAGFALRSRALSVLSAVVGAAWCGWIFAFMAYAFALGAENMGIFFAPLAGSVFVFRFWLLVIPPSPGEAYGSGW